ncbi:MAG: hypothetical protein IJO57_02460 [Bacilli bacterium]|nr:hypothetical protein [Bacilli bacterium]
MNDIKKRIASLALVGTMAVTPTKANGQSPEIHEDVILNEYLEYVMKVKNEDLSLYDIEFVKFFRNGNIVFNDKSYSVESLFLLECQKDGIRKIMLLCNDNIKYDILSGESYKGYKKISMNRFRDTVEFFNMFQLYKNIINNNFLQLDEFSLYEILNSFNGVLHDEAPETIHGKGRY